MSNKIRVISRNSALALLQVKELFSLFPEIEYSIQEVSSYGDKHKEVSLMDNITGDFFTRELDIAVLSGEADIAVHSAKDLPYPLPAGLELYCLTAAADKSDSLVSRGNLTLGQLPAGSRVGTSSAMRRAELLSLRDDIEVVSIRGTIEERIAQVDSGYVDALIVATCALQRLGLTDRIAQRLPFRTHPLQGNLAVIGRRGEENIFTKHDIRRSYGRVTLVGFGPGNPELLTIGGDRALREADIIFHDDLIDKQFVQHYKAEKVYVGKRAGRDSHRQDDINELMYQAAISGRRVVRLKGGDPMVFAHGREEIDYLQSRFVQVDVIPGVSSGIALSALTKIPLTHRGVASSVAFVSGHGANIQTPDADTLLYYMGGVFSAEIASKLIATGRPEDTPAALIYNVSLPDQRVFFSTLGELRRSVINYPAPVLIIVGRVVAVGAYPCGRPPSRILETGTNRMLSFSPTQRVKHTPVIAISAGAHPCGRPPLRGNAITVGAYPCGRPCPYNYIIFTSRHGVRYFFEMLCIGGGRPQGYAPTVAALWSPDAKIASIGPVTTAELIKHNIHPDIESPTQSAEGLIDIFRQQGITGERILLPRSDKGLASLSDGLRALGNDVTDLAVYENHINNDVERVDLTEYDKILFSSPSGVDAFKEIYGRLPDKTLLVAKGKTTFEHLVACTRATSRTR